MDIDMMKCDVICICSGLDQRVQGNWYDHKSFTKQPSYPELVGKE